MGPTTAEPPGRDNGPTEAPVDVRPEAAGVRLVLAGPWVLESIQRSEAALADALGQVAAGPVALDGSKLGRIDTAGAWLVETARRKLEADGVAVRLEGFSPAQAILIAAVEKTGRTEVQPPAPVNPIRQFLTVVGKGFFEVVADGWDLLAVLGQFSTALVQMLLWQRKMRWPAFVNHLERAGLQAVPIVALMSFLIGMILAQQGAFYLRSYGAELFVVDSVGVLVWREIGVLLTAIMVAGRSGSAFTAEIGSMKMREEIDALTVLGVSPVDVLVVPRLLALIVALPILTLVSNLAALAGAWIVVMVYIGMPTDTFLIRLQESLSLTNVLIGLGKAPVMALVIGLVACLEGMKVKGSAESLGEHTTASVVKAIFLVIVMDGVFAIFFAAADL